MSEQIRIVHGESPAELYEAVGTSPILSLRKVMAARVKAASLLFKQNGIRLEAMQPTFEEGVVLARALHESPLWTHRLTTSTHTVHTRGEYATGEWEGAPRHFRGIVDGGVRYPIDFTQQEGLRVMPRSEYKKHPGGSYPIEEWLKHPVLGMVVNDPGVLEAYGNIVRILSHAQLGSQGRASIWCPQSLPIGHGRAWALGEGGDGAYPPNLTTRHHWAAVQD